ncbi:LPS translocon maturation chaperone LptM [Aquirhabdus sp.]|uniref:LPS translocon maturation chaperone LptM n=1 Tax=Aquirhabdus sp. TaxID=2824160 RepID=UPI00396CEAF8
MSHGNVVVITTALAACLVLAGCGQKGALYLPNTNTTQNAKKTHFILGSDAASEENKKTEAAPVPALPVKDIPASSVVGSAS